MSTEWTSIGNKSNFPVDLGTRVKVKDKQIAVFNLNNGTQWYASQNLCPHDKRMVLSRGLTGSVEDKPTVICPLHKRTFDLNTGESLTDSACGNLITFPIKIEDDELFILVAE
jgi:nitrite reductase (NADH) small subunit